MYGTVVTVEVRQAATQLVGVHAPGVSVLDVASVDELPESGQVTVAGSTLAYTAVTSTEDPDGTAATDTIVLSAATAVGFPDGELVARFPKRQEKVALVVPTGSTVPVEARVKHSLADRLAEGSSGQVVYLIQRHGELGFVVDDVIGKSPVVDGGFLDPAAPITPGAIIESYTQFPDEHSGSVQAGALGDGTTSAAIVVQGSISSGDPASGSVRIDAQGLFTTSEGGATRSLFPNDPAQPDTHRGVGEFAQLKVSGLSSFAGPLTIERGSRIHLASNALMPAPAAAPTVTPMYYTTAVQFPDWSEPANRRGLALKSVSEAYTLEVSPLGASQLHRFDPSVGTYLGTVAFSGASGPGGALSVTYWPDADLLVTLDYSGSGTVVWFVRYWTTAGVFVSETVWAQGVALSAPAPALNIISTSGADRLMITRADYQSGVVTVWEYPPGMASTPTTTVVTGLTLPAAQRNLAGSVNVSASQMVVARSTGGAIYDTDAATGALVATYQMPNGEASAAGYSRDVTTVGTARTRLLSGTSNNLYTLTPLHEDNVWWAGYTFADSTTGHETALSPLTQFTRVKGTSILVSGGDIPAGTDSINVYVGDSPTPPPSTAMWRQIPVVPGNGNSPTDLRAWLIAALRANNTDGLHPNPPTVGTITSPSAIGYVESDDGTALIRGDKTGQIYDLIAAAGGGGGGPVVASGAGSGTTDASGVLTVSHTLGVTPAVIIVVPTALIGGRAATFFVTAKTSTTATCTVVQGGGAALASTAAAYSWIATA